jgi:S-layer homology domain.
VKTMVAAKITEGIGWGKVGIGLNITRQEAIKILATIIPTRDLSGEPVTVLAKDKDMIADWAAPYYQIMFKKGYLNNTEGTLGPTASLTREEAAILLLKIKKGRNGHCRERQSADPDSAHFRGMHRLFRP